VEQTDACTRINNLTVANPWQSDGSNWGEMLIAQTIKADHVVIRAKPLIFHAKVENIVAVE